MGQTIRDVTFQLMRDLNLTTIFGNPGSTEETFLKNYPADFRYIQALQEASAVAIADGYAQATRRPALVNVHTAAGVANAMSNIMTASMNQTPLIITAGNQTREMLLMEPWLMNVQPEDLPKPWVKWSYEPVRAADVPAAFMRAYAAALQPPAGPVFLSIPLDDWEQPAAGSNPVARTVATRVGPDPVRIAEFAQALSDAKDPALIFGASIARGDGWDQAVTLAEKLGVHVYAAPASERPPFPEDHPLYVGGLPFAIGPLSKKLTGHDVAIVIGAPVFRYYPYVAGDYLPDGLRLLHVTEDPAQAARAPVGDSLVSDAVLATEALTELIPGRPHRKVVMQPHRMAPHGPGVSVREDSRMGADELFATLYDAMPEDTVVVEESPSNLGDFHAAWPIVKPDSFYTFASGSLGWNLPAAVGLALAERDSGRNRPVMAMIGDGSMQYAVQGLHSAAQEQLPIIYVIPCNGEYAILKSFADLEDSPGVPGLDVPGLDVVALAKGYGCTGERAETAEEVRAAVARALGRPGPTVLEVPIEAKVPPLL
ncbi:benzoylformate decarboxylase [Tomitella fengzijianii]|uniref:acetolactate synthase n=1 Tax=Tomitella fengzijianii TaxID=2597660 RepID=A0A516X2Q6_9ACTN|nr:benzoylformate decarboxylase [Tomitella fengzijianii]QDQ97358.1 benzoylformate decarboxylase [Tomitella fengzijianii]